MSSPPRPQGPPRPELPMTSPLTQHMALSTSGALLGKPGFINSAVYPTRPAYVQPIHPPAQHTLNSPPFQPPGIPANNLARPAAPPPPQVQANVYAAGPIPSRPGPISDPQSVNNLVASMPNMRLENQRPPQQRPSSKRIYPAMSNPTPSPQQLKQPVSTLAAPWPHGLGAQQQPSPSDQSISQAQRLPPIALSAAPPAQANAHSSGLGIGYAQGPYSHTQHQLPPELRPPQQPRPRIDPDQMPSPVEVREKDQQLHGDTFFGTLKRDHIPLETTTYIGLDQGNCIPRYMRSSVDKFPATKSLAEQLKIPMGLVIQPLARTTKDELPIQVVDHGSYGPVRCNRCRGYINPWCVFTSGGEKFSCNLCSHSNEVPSWYFSNMDVSGRRVDLDQRPELRCGSIEFAVPEEYHSPRKPVPLQYVFALDVSSQAVRSGMLQSCCVAIRETLYGPEGCRLTPGSKVGLITYDRIVHFYNLSPELSQAQMLVIADIADIFIPMEHGFLVDPSEAKYLILELLQTLPNLFKDAITPQSVFTPAIRGVLAALSPTGGNLYIFQSCLSNHGPDALKSRDDKALYNTDKEKQLFNIQNQTYVDIGNECVKNAVCVHTWLFPSQYADVATLGAISSLTGGDIRYYPNFTARETPKIIYQLNHDLHRETGFDGVLRVRCSDGLQVVEHYGNCHMSTFTDMDLAGIDQDKAFAITLKHDSNLDKSKSVYFQTALLYTTRDGQRRVRVHNLNLPVSTEIVEVFRSGDADATISIMLRQAMFDMHHKSRREIHAKLSEVGVDILTAYRTSCAGSASPGQLILPEAFKLLPIYLHASLRLPLLRGVGIDLTSDSRMATMKSYNSMGVGELVSTLYPRLYAVHDLSDGYGRRDEHGRIKLPHLTRLSYDRLSNEGAYLLDTGSELFFWLGNKVPDEFLITVFGVPDMRQLNVNMVTLPVLDNQVSGRIRSIVWQLKEDRTQYLQLRIVRQDMDPTEFVFSTWMAEDRNSEVQTYVDYMCVLHRKIQDEMKKNSNYY